jgi:DNA-directed RNA polymerase subunit RPC12/RpoP
MSDLKCLNCQGEVEFAGGGMYARCKSCNSMFMNVTGTWNPYPVDDSMRAMIEQSLGFAPGASANAAPTSKPKAPANCLICTTTLEVVQNGDSVYTRCPKCGNLSEVTAYGGLQVINVTPPGGGWDPKFQAIFEQELGFTFKMRKMPIGIPE